MATRIDPFRELDRLAGQLLSPVRGLRQMPMDLYKDGDRYIVEADLPGVDPSSVDVDVDGQLLTIRAERKSSVSEGAQWMTRERETGSYVRQLNLGQDVDLDNISATYEHGVLKVTIPVSPKSQPRKVKVSTGDGAQDIQATATENTGGQDQQGQSTPQVDPNN